MYQERADAMREDREREYEEMVHEDRNNEDAEESNEYEALGFGIGRFFCLELDRLTYSTDIWYYCYCTVTWAQAGACS